MSYAAEEAIRRAKRPGRWARREAVESVIPRDVLRELARRDLERYSLPQPTEES